MFREMLVLLVLPVLMPETVVAAEFGMKVPMQEKGAVTYYVPAHFDAGMGADLMVDTGSGYLVINEGTLAALKEKGRAEYVKKVSGTMADGSKTTVPIYRIASLSIGCCCLVQDVEAAVFPGSTRQILGLSALRKVAPFALSMEPPRLMLSNCETGVKAGSTAASF